MTERRMMTIRSGSSPAAHGGGGGGGEGKAEAAYFTAGMTGLFAFLAALLVFLPLVLPPLPPPPSMLLLVPVGLMAVLLALTFLPADGGRRSSIAVACL